MKKFKSDAVLRSATFSFIASQLIGKKERDLLSTTFRYFNKNNDGRLTHEEVRQAFKEFKHEIGEEQLNNLFKAIDTDMSGSISFSEFITAAMTERSLTS